MTHVKKEAALALSRKHLKGNCVGLGKWNSSRPGLPRYGRCICEANRFHLMAEAEPSDRVRNQLLSVSQQYQQLADSLNAGHWRA